MNDKAQAILLKLVLELKKLRWKVNADTFQLDLKMEGYATLKKLINVQGNLGDDQWDDQIETTIDVKFDSGDEVTFFPEFNIRAEISVPGGPLKDIVNKSNNDIAFTKNDLNNDAKIALAAKSITRSVEDRIEHEYDEYLTENGEEIQYQKTHGDPLGGDSPDD